MFGEVQKHWPLDFKQDAVDAPQGVFVRDVFFLIFGNVVQNGANIN